MEDFGTRTYGTSGLDNRPLFGETSARVGLSGLWERLRSPRPSGHDAFIRLRCFSTELLCSSSVSCNFPKDFCSVNLL